MSVSSTDKKDKVFIETGLLDLESINKDENIFQDPAVAEYYYNLYETTKYECRSHFDPEFTWSKEEERKVTWKNDWHVTFWSFMMFTALNFDRSNLAQALSDNFLDDLNLTTNQMNIGKTINLVCFLAAELPSQLISKKIGADVWIPTQMMLWSIVAMCQAAITGKHGFYATRALIGLLEGGFICDTCLWISYFFTSTEYTNRMSFFYASNQTTTIISSLLAFALLKIKTSTMSEGWRWLFLIEGAFTLLIGIASWFLMPASPVQTKTWYRPKGWYTDREEKIVVNKVLRDDPTKGDMHNRQPVTLKELGRALFDFDLFPIYLIRFLIEMSSGPVASYLQLSLRQLGFSTFKTNALTIPNSVLSLVTMFAFSYISDIIDSRSLLLAVNALWCISTLIPLRYWPGSGKPEHAWGSFALMTVLLGHPPLTALSTSWCSANSNSVKSRAVSAAVVNIFSQAGSIIASNIYREDDAPLYHRGNTQLIGIAFGGLGIAVLSRFYFQYRNKQRDRKWKSLSELEKLDYTKNTTDQGNKRLDFRFIY
ncbi:uncharacterized protein PRCAT00005104001 [Priceomyces carsonii]|uniref:uncharacterized protein n=1 Tax=Priceomyces carsonii TaxID=28549 RepID=UPI002ED8A01D|nr:unnamed protein product [Priceomyces carsonii]